MKQVFLEHVLKLRSSGLLGFLRLSVAVLGLVIFILLYASFFLQLEGAALSSNFFAFVFLAIEIVFLYYYLFKKKLSRFWLYTQFLLAFFPTAVLFSSTLGKASILFLFFSWFAVILLNVSLLQKRNVYTSAAVSKKPAINNRGNLHANSRRFFWYLLCVLILAFSIRAVLAVYADIDLDEGIHLYDAHLVLRGLIPFRDFFSREPYFIYTLAGVEYFLGAHLYAARFLSVITSTVLVGVLYKIGAHFFAPRVGVIAALVYAVAPIIVYNTYLGNLYSLYSLVMGVVFYLFLRLVEQEGKGVFRLFFTGFLLGASVHFYRLAVFFFPVVGLAWGYLMIHSRKQLISFLLFYLASALGFFPPLIFFMQAAGFKQFDVQYGFYVLLIAYCSIGFFVIAGFLARKVSGYFKRHAAGYFFASFVILSLLSLFAFYFFGIAEHLKARILFGALLQAWSVLFFVAFALLLYARQVIFATAPRLYTVFKYIFLMPPVFVAIYGSMVARGLSNFGARPIPADIHGSFLVLFLLSIIFLLFYERWVDWKQVSFPRLMPLFILLLLAPVAFYSIHVQWHVNNITMMLVMGSIIAAVGFVHAWSSFRLFSLVFRLFALFIFIALVLLPVRLYNEQPLRDRLWDQSARVEVGAYIQSRTQLGEEIFTMATLFPLENGRRNALDLSRIMTYSLNKNVEQPSYIGVANNLVPSEELAMYVEKNINLILMDARARRVFVTNPAFKDILSEYHLDKRWPVYDMEAWIHNE